MYIIEDVHVIAVGNDMKVFENNIKEAIDLYLENNSNLVEKLIGKFEVKFKIGPSITTTTSLRKMY